MKKLRKIVVTFRHFKWTIYPCSCRGNISYKVPVRENGKRRFKSFANLDDARAAATDVIRAVIEGSPDRIIMSDLDKQDWAQATQVLRNAGFDHRLEPVTRHYVDAVKIIGKEVLLVEAARFYAKKHHRACTPTPLLTLVADYLQAMKAKNCSKRYTESLQYYCGTFAIKAPKNLLADEVSREVLQNFLDGLAVSGRTKVNFASSIRTMFEFGKKKRYVSEDWDEADQIELPLVKRGLVPVFSAEELKRLFAVAPKEFIPCLALNAFAAIRPAEIQRLGWSGIDLSPDKREDRIISLDAPITKVNSRRIVRIHETLWQWLSPCYKMNRRVWNGTHDHYSHAQRATAKVAGVEWKHDAVRHTCISARVALTRDIPSIAYESGNSDYVIKRDYLRLLNETAANAWFDVSPSVVDEFRKQLTADGGRKRAGTLVE